jgi:hypothetical protein
MGLCIRNSIYLYNPIDKYAEPREFSERMGASFYNAPISLNKILKIFPMIAVKHLCYLFYYFSLIFLSILI